MDALTDEQVVELIREGDEAAAALLFERYFPLLRARARRRLPPALRRKVAESDIVQEAYLGAIQRLKSFEDRGEGSLGGWLIQIMDRRVSDAMRRYTHAAKRDVNREQSVEAGVPAVSDPRQPDSVSADLRHKEAVRLVLRSIEGLSPRDRQVLHLVHFKGQTVAQAAEAMGAPVGATRMQYARALVRLQKQMGETETSDGGG